MKMLTAEILKKLPKLYTQENNPDPIIVVKFFCPWNQWTWYATEGEKDGDDFRFFGMVHGHEKELGYFMLSELESVRGPGGLKIERDMHWTPKPLSSLEPKPKTVCEAPGVCGSDGLCGSCIAAKEFNR